MSPSDQLTAEDAARLVQAALGRGAPPWVSPIREGGEHHSWWVDDDLAARFCPDRETTPRLRREVAVRDLIRPRMSVPVPRSVAFGEWGDGFGFTVDTRLHGASGEKRSLSPAGEAQLVELLRALRAVPVAEAAALGVPTRPPVRWQRLAADAEAARQRMVGTEKVPATPVRVPAEGVAPARVLVHADLKGEHLVVPEDGTLAGIVDWADACLAEPVLDITGLAISVGGPAAHRIATEAGYPDETATHGVFLARCETLIRLDERLRGRPTGPLPLLRTQLARAWQDSL